MEQLKRLRKERGLSQAKLAALADIDPSTMNQIERGAREPTTATLRKLAAALDVSLAELLEESETLKAGRRSSLEPSLFNGLEDEPREIEPEVAGLFRTLAKRARLITETSRRQGGPSAELGEQVELLYEEVAHVLALRRLLPRWGSESDELADAEDAYEKAERAIQAMIRQDLEATDEERREVRRFRSDAEDARSRREADAS